VRLICPCHLLDVAMFKCLMNGVLSPSLLPSLLRSKFYEHEFILQLKFNTRDSVYLKPTIVLSLIIGHDQV
jgi:hypothetical protein